MAVEVYKNESDLFKRNIERQFLQFFKNDQKCYIFSKTWRNGMFLHPDSRNAFRNTWNHLIFTKKVQICRAVLLLFMETVQTVAQQNESNCCRLHQVLNSGTQFYFYLQTYILNVLNVKNVIIGKHMGVSSQRAAIFTLGLLIFYEIYWQFFAILTIVPTRDKLKLQHEDIIWDWVLENLYNGSFLYSSLLTAVFYTFYLLCNKKVKQQLKSIIFMFVSPQHVLFSINFSFKNCFKN